MRYVVSMLVVAAGCTILLGGCAVVRVATGPVQQVEVPYTFRGRELAAIVAQPAVQTATMPVAVLVEGDGARCQEWRPRLWRRRLDRLAGHYALAWPRGLVSVTCDTAAWQALDLNARLDELGVIVGALRARWPERPVFLIGHSAGADLAIRYATAHADEVRGIVNLAGGLRELAEMMLTLVQVRADKERWPAARRDAELADTTKHLSELRARSDGDAPLWNRSVRFWQELYFTPLFELWRNVGVPTLVIHGRRDERMAFELVERDVCGLLRAGRPITWLPLPTHGHNLFDAEVFRAVDAWIMQRGR